MNPQKKKIIAFVVFLIVIIGGGFLLTTRINRNGIQKTGYKTEYNPNYVDSMVRAKNK